MSRLTHPPSGKRTKYLIVVAWLLIASIAAPLALQLPDAVTDDEVSWLPRSAEATAAFERAQSAFPDADRLVAVAVYAREGGLTDADRAKAAADREAFARHAVDGRVPPPVASADRQALLVSFPLAGTDKAQESAAGTIRDRLEAGAPAGLETGLTGSAGAEKDLDDAFAGLDGMLLFVAAGVVALILLITYRSPILWLIPLISVAVANYVAMAAVYLLAEGGLTVNFQAQSILTVLLFGVGTDYALLLIARYREELRRHSDRHEAMAVALRRSFAAILASAATVTLGLLALLAAELNSTRGLGPVAAVGVVSAFVVMTTLLPALLVLFGRWVFWPFVPRYDQGAADHDVADDHPAWGKVARFVGRRPRPIWIGTAVALGVLTLGVSQMSVGLRDADTFTEEVGSVTGQRLIERHYPAGASYPADIYATARAADETTATARSVDGVAEVQAPLRSSDGQWVHVQAVLAAAPDSQAAKDTVDRLRDAVHAVPGAQALVGGNTAVDLDTERASDRDNKVVIPLILSVVFLILVVLLRAIVAPVLLLTSVVLSFAAAMGVAALIFEAIGHPDVWVGFPLQAFLFLVALGVDYTIFLMTRAREEAGELGHRRGVLHALTVTGGVITSAGLVLAATFSALVVLPLVPSLQIGIVVAVGVLLDTFLVRSLLVPALAVDVGRRVWWPGRLARGDDIEPQRTAAVAAGPTRAR
jgi:putative drug exporter of the RND superfamily